MSLEKLQTIPKYKLLTQVLEKSNKNSEVQELIPRVNSSKWIQQLLKEQKRNGGWDRFHSRNTKVSSVIPTTEYAIDRAIAIGLPFNHHLLKSTCKYLENILLDKIPFPDPAENNPRWKYGSKLFTTSYLSLIDPQNAILKNQTNMWKNILIEAFQSGTYEIEDELKGHKENTDLTDLKYLKLNSKYHVTLFQSIQTQLPSDLVVSYFDWLIRQGIGYLHPNGSITPVPNTENASYLDKSWFSSLELLSRFTRAQSILQDHIEWIYVNNVNNRWDFYGKSPSSIHFPYSSDWRTQFNQTIDWSVRVLVLLKSLLTNC